MKISVKLTSDPLANCISVFSPMQFSQKMCLHSEIIVGSSGKSAQMKHIFSSNFSSCSGSNPFSLIHTSSPISSQLMSIQITKSDIRASSSLPPTFRMRVRRHSNSFKVNIFWILLDSTNSRRTNAAYLDLWLNEQWMSSIPEFISVQA